tara:strand:+ start:180 stop:428 length:249 start_codon:yes stop_codon:yes gene_type:complete
MSVFKYYDVEVHDVVVKSFGVFAKTQTEALQDTLLKMNDVHSIDIDIASADTVRFRAFDWQRFEWQPMPTANVNEIEKANAK